MTPPSDDIAGFFEKNYDRVFGYIRGMVHDPNEAEDLTQEAFFRAFRERETLKDPRAMLAWLFRIATHVTLDRLRQRAIVAPRESGVDLIDLDPPDPMASCEEILQQEQMSACVQAFIVDIPDIYRSVILFHDAHGMTAPEIAEVLGVTVATVKMRLHRARSMLRAALEEGCEFSCDSRGVVVCVPKR